MAGDNTNNKAMDAQSNLSVYIDTAFRITIAVTILSYLHTVGDETSLLTTFGLVSVLGAILYSTLCFIMTYRSIPTPRQATLVGSLACLDVFLTGAIVSLINYPIVVMIPLLPLIVIRGVGRGGLASLFTHLVATAAGAGLVSALNYPYISVTVTSSTTSVGLISATLFLSYLVHALFYRNRSLSRSLEEAQTQIVNIKLTNYKLSKYLSPTLKKAISSGKGVKLETQRKRISIFFSDIKGFSELSEELETEALTELLNSYLSEMSNIAIKFGGTVDKFIGDAIMVFFGDPVTRGAKADSVACVSMAIAMQKRMQQLRQHWQQQGFKAPLQVRMGINTGFCTVGNFGTENRLDYTLLGTEVNLASRLESAATAGEVLISESTYELVKDLILCEERGEYTLKGFKEPVTVYAAIDLRKNLDKADSYMELSTEGFSMYLDMDQVKEYEHHKVMQLLEGAYEQLRLRNWPSASFKTENKKP